MLRNLLLAAVVLPATVTMASAQTQPGRAPAQTAPAAPTAAAPAVGDTILDSAGTTIGTVESVTPQAVTINAGTYKVPVPPTSIGKSDKGWSMAMTKAQIDAAMQQQQAASAGALKAALVPGAAIKASDGAQVGTVKVADAQYVTVTTTKGDVKLPINAVGVGADGTLALGMTQAQFEAALPATGASAGAAATTTPPAKTPTK